MSRYKHDPEFLKALTVVLASQPPPPPINNFTDLLERTNEMLALATTAFPSVDNVQKKVFHIKSYDGAEIAVTRFTTEAAFNAKEPQPAVIYAHGGGMIGGYVELYSQITSYYAGKSDVNFFGVEYRLAPDHPAPAAIEDFYATLKHVSENAAEFNVDPKRLAVMGDSAGGGIAASAALVARDRKLDPPLAKQFLIYPMLDDRTVLEEDDPLNKFINWNGKMNAWAWDAYIGAEKRAKANGDYPCHASAARAESLKDLPPTYLDVGTLDLFADEVVEYSRRLLQDRVEVELHVLPGLPHGFEAVPHTVWYQKTLDGRIRALKSF